MSPVCTAGVAPTKRRSNKKAACKGRLVILRLLRGRRSGFGAGTRAGLRFLGCIETLGEATALAVGGVLVNGALGGDLRQTLGDLLQFLAGLVEVTMGDGGEEGLHFVLD